MAKQQVLRELLNEDDRLRTEASHHVESGMLAIVGGKRSLQKLVPMMSMSEGEELGIAFTRMMNAGIGLRVMLQAFKRHHQRAEAPWADPENSLGSVLRSALNFEQDAEEFMSLVNKELSERRSLKRNRKDKSLAPSPTEQIAPVNTGSSPTYN